MSCELPCVGPDVVGIKEDIQHMETGYLCKTDYKSIANAIETVLSDDLQ
jgi:glycosyltransferase involved in cell wall biosynthesis